MASRGNELVRPVTVVGTEAEVHAWLQNAERRGMVRGQTFAVARLEGDRVALKVNVVRHDPGKSFRWPLTPGQTLALVCGLGALAFLAVVLWLIVQAITAIGKTIENNAGPIVGVLIILGLITLFSGRGGGGTFSGTFKGTWR